MIPPLSTPAFSVLSKRILVTGGSQGLGYAIAASLMKAGAKHVGIMARTRAKGEAAALQLSALGGDGASASFYETDISCPTSIATSFSSAISDMGGVDGLVNAAATTDRGNLMTTSAEDFDWQMNVNCRGPMLATQAAARHMVEAGTPGSIVNITSVAAKGGAPFIMAYSASKAALECLTRNNAAELAPHQVRVNAVAMGWCYTENEDKLQTAQTGDANWVDEADRQQPIGRILRPEDVAPTVGHLLSDAANMITGNVVDLHPEFASGMLSLAAVDSVER